MRNKRILRMRPPLSLRGAKRRGNLGSLILVIACVAVITLGIFYAILGECDIRELKANKRAWFKVITERDMAQYYADRDAEKWSR